MEQGAVEVDGDVRGGAIINVKPGHIIKVGKHRFYRIVDSDRTAQPEG
jgi:hypothetical protein